jgi:flagellar motor switch protein FliM
MFRKLQDAAGERPGLTPNLVAGEFDWKIPCCFTLGQLQRLRELGAAVSKRLGEALAKLLRAEISLEPVQVNLRYGKAALEAFAAAQPYYVPLTDEGATACGCLVMPAVAATKFVGKFLGATGDSATPGRALSPLEQELLLDVVRAVANELSAELTSAGAKGVKTGPLGRTAPPGMELAECCCFVMGSAGTDLPLVALVLQCGFVEGVFAASGMATAKITQQESAKRLTTHLGVAQVVASVWLGNAELSMKDVMALETGDVLLLSTKAGQPVDLMVQGQPLAYGLMVRNQDRYAMQITDRLELAPPENEGQTPPVRAVSVPSQPTQTTQPSGKV